MMFTIFVALALGCLSFESYNGQYFAKWCEKAAGRTDFVSRILGTHQTNKPVNSFLPPDKGRHRRRPAATSHVDAPAFRSREGRQRAVHLGPQEVTTRFSLEIQHFAEWYFTVVLHILQRSGHVRPFNLGPSTMRLYKKIKFACKPTSLVYKKTPKHLLLVG